jgi:intermediate cleaving peptidase 55
MDIDGIDSTGAVLGRLLDSGKEPKPIGQRVDTGKVKPLRQIMSELRVFKSDDEIDTMRKAGQASGRAFTKSMTRGFTQEKDLNAFLEYQFKVHGCESTAFVPVVAGGRVRNNVFSLIGLMLIWTECSEYSLC